MQAVFRDIAQGQHLNTEGKKAQPLNKSTNLNMLQPTQLFLKLQKTQTTFHKVTALC